MAKSEGTGFALSEIIEKGFDPIDLRYFFLTAHYRSQQNFTWEALSASQKALHELRAMVSSWKEGSRFALSPEKLEKVDLFRTRFKTALEHDLNVPSALAVVWEMAKSNIPASDKYDLAMDFDQVLGLNLNAQQAISNQLSTIPHDIQTLADTRETLRNDKKFDEADAVRKEIEQKGYVLEDSPKGTIVKKAP